MTETNPQNRRLGYARVSTYGQTLEAQREQLQAAGCRPIYRETASGARADRRELQRMLKGLRAGDVVTVTRIDRLARSTFDLFAIVKRITGAGAQFRSLAEPWADTATSTGRLMIAVLGGLADVERDLIRTRTAEGRSRATAQGQHMGRAAGIDPPTGRRGPPAAAGRGNAQGVGRELQRQQGDDFQAIEDNGMSAAKPGRTNTDIEQHYFEKFRAAYPLPAGTLSYGDKPDVILNGERQVGIEITNFFLQEGSYCKSEQKQRPLRAKAVCEARELYRAAGGRGIELTIEFDASNPITGDRKGKLPRELAELARQSDSRLSGPLEKSLFSVHPETA